MVSKVCMVSEALLEYTTILLYDQNIEVKIFYAQSPPFPVRSGGEIEGASFSSISTTPSFFKIR